MIKRKLPKAYIWRSASKRRFTLVELLVVIAIIAVLAALLLPALNTAKGSARQIACMNNQRQAGISFMNYSNDYNSFFPWAWSDEADLNSRTYAHLLYNGGVSSLKVPTFSMSASLGEIQRAQGAVNFLKCPADSSIVWNQPINYGMNGQLQFDYGVLDPSSNDPYWGIVYPKVTKIKESLSVKSLLTCSQRITYGSYGEPRHQSYYVAGTYYDINGDGQINVLDGWRNVHMGFMNALYCDGHADKKKSLMVSKEVGR